MSGTLSANSPKFESKLVTHADLRALPEPIALGPNHKPVPHVVLVDSLLNEIDRRGYEPIKTQFALGHKGDALFGVIDLKGKTDDRSLALGFRNSVDRSLGIQGVAGSHVFVCDNLALSGSTFAFKRKNTTGLDLGSMVANGFDRFLQHAEAFDIQVARLQGIALNADRVKAVIYDVFAARIIPIRLFDDVNRFYFAAEPETVPEIADNRGNVWGVHNAFTRAMKDLSPVRQFGATVALGSALGIIDAEVNEF
jgi:hypothetical protein